MTISTISVLKDLLSSWEQKWAEVICAASTRSCSFTSLWNFSSGHRSTVLPGGRHSAPTAKHELIPLVSAGQLSRVLFWSFSGSSGECCPVWGHHVVPLDAGFLFCYLEVCQTTREESEGRNRCSRKLPDPKRFRHRTLPDHRKANSENTWQLRWKFFSCHTRLSVAAKHFF